ncbi:MAG: hypothetical protein R2741_09150 [Methanolobus sp.]
MQYAHHTTDFDGDEMNMHVLQTEESRAEASILMQVQENILSPRFGGPIIGGIHDHISGLFLLTRNENKITKNAALELLRKSDIEVLPEPASYSEERGTTLEWKTDFQPDPSKRTLCGIPCTAVSSVIRM